MYQSHPSHALNLRFQTRPFQGAEPKSARFLFVGLDANYAENIEDSAIFPGILTYHEDGTRFWQQHGVHHPFLLDGYRGDGRRYHQNFARFGFTPDHAAQVSFVELLHVPTVGRSQLTVDDLDTAHLERLNSAILDGAAEHVFIPRSVAALMRQTRKFAWMAKQPSESPTLPVLYQRGGKSVYQHLHLSNYGRFEAQMRAEARAIGALLATNV
jgi:hypothetical protein